ncbi:MAG: radical SAM family heme chaperone HemW [Lacibacter sp.]
MAGLYIHIPFCRQACAYCNFHFTTSLRSKNELISALLKELELQHQNNYLGTTDLETIYFGGGTPSLLELNEIEAILKAATSLWNLNKDAEITLEANPDDISDLQLEGWKQAGINRLSIGIQSLYDEDLKWMNRAHTAAEARAVLARSRKAGFEQFTVDLIYGTPGLTDEKWMNNLKWVVDEGLRHVSCYALTVEDKTPLSKQIARQLKQDTDPEQQRNQFLMLMDFMEQQGFEHYEISNFAKPGHRSQHNSAYWNGTPYLGVGPSAHSFDGVSRQWNCSNNRHYIEALKQNNIPFEQELLTPTQRLNEYIMTHLRLAEGCDLELIAAQYGNEESLRLEKLAQTYEQRGWLAAYNRKLILTREGKLFADRIAAELFL